MAVDKKVVDYVKNQLKTGYTPQQISAALANSGYTQADINEAMSAGGASKPAKGAAPALGAGEPVIGFWLSLIGGAVIIIGALLPVLDMTILEDVFSFFPVVLAMGDMSMILGMVFGAIAAIGAVLINMMPENKLPGIIVLAISVIALLMGPGFFIGAVVGIIGGAMAFLGR